MPLLMQRRLSPHFAQRAAQTPVTIGPIDGIAPAETTTAACYAVLRAASPFRINATVNRQSRCSNML